MPQRRTFRHSKGHATTTCMMVAVTVLAIGAALSARPHDALTNRNQPVLWSDSIARAGARMAEIPECETVACIRFALEVDLPSNTWAHGEGGVQIGIRWVGYGNNLRLFIYRGGELIAKSDGIIATAQAVRIPEAPNGTYDVYVAFDPDSPDDVIAYEALAQVEYAPRHDPIRALLPDLTMLPQRNVSFEASGFPFDVQSSEYPSCYVTEVEEDGARLCFRFDQIVSNEGEGPIELRFSVPREGSGAPVDPLMYQRIHWSNGGHVDRAASPWEFHPSHGHYHFTGFAQSNLWAVDAKGRKSGHAPARAGRKVSFCFADTDMVAWAKRGDAPRTYMAPDCLFPASSDGSYDYFLQGTSAGWGDTYDWLLPGQYIEVSDVPDGTYLLETTADPDNVLEETNDRNNCIAVYVRLSGLAAGSPSAQIVGPGPRCAK